MEEVAFEAMSLMSDGTAEWWSEYGYFQTLLKDHQLPSLAHKRGWLASDHLKCNRLLTELADLTFDL